MLNKLVEQALDTGDALFLVDTFGQKDVIVQGEIPGVDDSISIILVSPADILECVIVLDANLFNSGSLPDDICDFMSHLQEGAHAQLTEVVHDGFILGFGSEYYMVIVSQSLGTADLIRKMKGGNREGCLDSILH